MRPLKAAYHKTYPIPEAYTATIQFTGNSTNKTYYDYITEVTNQLNAKQIVWDNKKPDPGFKKKVHFKETKKTKVLKRKLTF